MKKLMIAAAACCLMLSSCGDDEPQRIKYESVDLGLSVRWATTNVGALTPQDHGQLFGWADSTGSHRKFDNINISYRDNGDGTETTMVNWNSVYFGGKNPPLDISSTAYDIAIYNWNANWRMPTMDEWKELVDRCTWATETTASGATVWRVTGPNGNSIVLPMTGIRATSNSEEQRSSIGCYWTSTLLPIEDQAALRYESAVPCAAWYVKFDSGTHPTLSTAVRCTGMAVRPVASK